MFFAGLCAWLDFLLCRPLRLACLSLLPASARGFFCDRFCRPLRLACLSLFSYEFLCKNHQKSALKTFSPKVFVANIFFEHFCPDVCLQMFSSKIFLQKFFCKNFLRIMFSKFLCKCFGRIFFLQKFLCNFFLKNSLPMSLHEYASYIDFEVGTNPTVRICAVVQTHHLRTNHIISYFGTSHVLLGKTVAMGGGNLKMTKSWRGVGGRARRLPPRCRVTRSIHTDVAA